MFERDEERYTSQCPVCDALLDRDEYRCHFLAGHSER